MPCCSNPYTPYFPPQCLELVDKFASAGESFTESEAVGLRSKLLKQSDVFFKTFHKQNLKAWNIVPLVTLTAPSCPRAMR